MSTVKTNLSLATRILICILFILSAVAKMDKIWIFEKQLVDLDIATWCSSPYFARTIIAIELAVGFAVLQNHFIKRFVIPATILLLAGFCVHLSIEMYKHGAMNGNCGCFGQLIPMTPFEAFIKNILTIGLLIYLFRNVQEKEKGSNRPIYLITIFLASALFMFAGFPIPPCDDVTDFTPQETQQLVPMENTTETPSKQIAVGTTTPAASATAKNTAPTTEKPVSSSVQTDAGPKKIKSKFARYTTYGSKLVNPDDGKKLICMFVPGCDHCRDAAKEIGIMSKKEGFPEVAIIFMDEETELIPEFFEVTKTNFPYQVIGIVEFWKLLGDDANTPGVFYLWNGNIIRQYEGTEDSKFDPADLKKIVFKN